MTYKETFYFTGQCLSLEEHPSLGRTIVKRIQKDEFNWECLVQLCSDHLVIPALYLQLKAHGIPPYLPRELNRTLTEIYTLNLERNSKILLQVEDIVAALLLKSIVPVFLKGTANLLDGLYCDLGERMIGDIDFLVPEEDYLQTAAVLVGMGYNHQGADYFDFKSLKHYPRLSKPSAVAPVEIHRLPVPSPYADQFNSAEIFRDKKAVAWKKGLFVPSDQHKLIHTFIHGQLAEKSHAYKQSTFRELNDLYRLSKRVQVFSLPIHTRYQKKAIAWLVFGQRALCLPGRFYPFEPKGAKWFVWKYNLALRYTKIYNGYTFLRKLMFLLFVRYAGGFVKAIFLESQRLSVYRRLKDPQWYGAHLRSFNEYF